MADGPPRSPRLDRVAPPAGARRPDRRDGRGKEALYSTSPSAAPTSAVLVVCERCDVETGLSLREAVGLVLRPAIVRPLARRIWSRCPACGRCSWLRFRQGQALRSLLGRLPGRGRGRR